MSKRPCPSHVGSSTSPSGRRAACRDFGRMLSAPSRRYLPGRRRGPEADPPRVPRRATAAVGALPPAASASAAAAGWPLAMRRVPCRGWRRRPPSWPTPVHRARRRGRRAPATRTPRAAASWEIWVRRAGTAARRGPHAALLPRAPSGAKKLAWGGGLANPDAAVAHGVERGARRLGVCHGSEASRCHADQWSGAATTAARRRAAAASARPRRRAFSMFFPCLLARARSVSGPSERAHTLGCVAGATARARGGPGTRFVCLVLCLLGARTLARHSLHGSITPNVEEGIIWSSHRTVWKDARWTPSTGPFVVVHRGGAEWGERGVLVCLFFLYHVPAQPPCGGGQRPPTEARLRCCCADVHISARAGRRAAPAPCCGSKHPRTHAAGTRTAARRATDTTGVG